MVICSESFSAITLHMGQGTYFSAVLTLKGVLTLFRDSLASVEKALTFEEHLVSTGRLPLRLYGDPFYA